MGTLPLSFSLNTPPTHNHHHHPLPLFASFPTADIISTVEFNHTGELLATGDKGGRVVIFQREPEVVTHTNSLSLSHT